MDGIGDRQLLHRISYEESSIYGVTAPPPKVVVVVVVVVELVGAGAGGGGADWSAYWPRVNGFHTGGCFGSEKS